MPSEEELRTKLRAAKQAVERDLRHNTRSEAKQDSSDATNSQPSAVTPSTDTISTLQITMEAQYKAIIDSIPTFSGTTPENVITWLDIVSLKFDLLNYEPPQRRRFIPQYLAGTALQWHMTHRNQLLTWDEYITALSDAFPRTVTTSRDMNLQKLRDRKQGDTEAFTDYYNSILELCRQHNPDMAAPQIIDWLKSGMKLTLYERLQGEDFPSPQHLLVRSQRLELDQAVLDARKNERPKQSYSNAPLRTPTRSFYHENPTYSHQLSTSYYTPVQPPPLMPISSSPRPSSQNPRRPIVCYTCGQHGHISPQCSLRPNY